MAIQVVFNIGNFFLVFIPVLSDQNNITFSLFFNNETGKLLCLVSDGRL